jgi:signal transduction histidine kinase
MKTKLRVLIVEDSEDDTLLLLRELRQNGYEPHYSRVDTAGDMERAFQTHEWDIIISDHSMPNLDAIQALAILQKFDEETPFIILSGTIGEAVAVEAMRAGAHDYIMKGNVARLIPAIERELQEAAVRRERKRAEEALLQAQKLESMGLLASGVAHDFNNLLVAMLGQCSLALAKVPPGSKAQEHILKTIEAAERAADLTRQMLAYAGRGRFKFRPIALNELISDNLSLLDATMPGSIEFREELCESLPLIVADPGQMQQVVMNLILNAAEAIEGRSGTVTIRTGLCESGTGEQCIWTYLDDLEPCPRYAVLEVQDSGIGMDTETLKRIFDPFFTTKKSGRGLGLASVLGIVRGHKGGLCIESQPDQGTTFRLLFPTMPMEEISESEAEEEVDEADGLILVIDDEPSVREAITDILEMEGMQVVSAANGSEGVALYERHKDEVGLVVLDLSLPGISGEDTLRLIRGIDPDVQVLLSSGRSQTAAQERYACDHAVGYLPKPFDGKKLIGAIHQHIGANGSD